MKKLIILLITIILLSGCLNNDIEVEKSNEVIEAINQINKILNEFNQTKDIINDNIDGLYETVSELNDFLNEFDTNMCELNTSIDKLHDNAEIKINVLEIHNDNVVVQNPVTNQVTFEIDERLVGRYVAENPYVEYFNPLEYFEIKSNGELEIAIMTFSGLAEYKKSENLILTAFYQTDIRVIISFRLVGGEYTFPGILLSLDFEGNWDCTDFEMIMPLKEFENVRFVKVS
ncbi:MAG: hypothetical protein FWD48_04025 [Oscillospiraceae bacterium]|nr:hypothetical protein [Oscillospiraceae bacterium]